MLCTANYEARKYGVRSAMPGFLALKLCPELVIVPLQFKLYHDYSNRVRNILREYDPHFSSMGCDEATMNLTKFLDQHNRRVEDVVQEIRRRIVEETKLTASAGIAPNRLLAKICSDKNKPNGQYHLGSTRREVREFIDNLPVRKLCGVGKVTERILEALDCKTCKDVVDNRAYLYKLLTTKAFEFILAACMGIGSTQFTE